jgi:gamma-glutamylcyclotransferase (GGCT)/AIG2-like uncharacterized protein YtfP
MSETLLLFVYGTLKRGGLRHGPLARQRFVGEARTQPRYALYDLGSYPGMVAADPGMVIHGEVYEVSRGLIPALDAMEGAPNLFALAEVALELGPAWAYLYQRAVEGRAVLPSGRWELC